MCTLSSNYLFVSLTKFNLHPYKRDTLELMCLIYKQRLHSPAVRLAVIGHLHSYDKVFFDAGFVEFPPCLRILREHKKVRRRRLLRLFGFGPVSQTGSKSLCKEQVKEGHFPALHIKWAYLSSVSVRFWVCSDTGSPFRTDSESDRYAHFFGFFLAGFSSLQLRTFQNGERTTEPYFCLSCLYTLLCCIFPFSFHFPVLIKKTEPLPHTYTNVADLPANFTWMDEDGISYLTVSHN